MDKFKWSLIISAASILISIGTCLASIVYVVAHNKEISIQRIEDVRSIERLKVGCASADNLEREVTNLRNWAIAIYERVQIIDQNIPPVPKGESE